MALNLSRRKLRVEPRPIYQTEATRTGITPDHIALYNVPSRTRPDMVFHPVVNLSNGLVDCDCENFNLQRMPKARREHVRPDIATPRYQCFHVQLAVLDCIDRKDIILTLSDALSEPDLIPNSSEAQHEQ